MGNTIGDAAADAGFPYDHVDYVCPPGYHDNEYYAHQCMFCDGGLTACTVCNGFEGAMTTQCPGRRMTTTENDEVYAGKLDFRGGRWAAATSFYAPKGYVNYAHALEGFN